MLQNDFKYQGPNYNDLGYFRLDWVEVFMRYVVYWLGLVLMILGVSSAAQTLRLAVPGDVFDDYQALLAGRDPLSLQDFASPHARRDTVELLLVQQALAAGGWQGEIDWRIINSYERILLDLSSGLIDATATSMWTADLAEARLPMSDPIIEEGQFVVGVYVHESRQDLLEADWSYIREQRAISNFAWQTDIDLLRSLGVDRILSNPTYATQMRMLALGRADFRLLSFRPKSDLATVQDDERFVPIPGIKVAMPGSRSIGFSRSEQAIAARLAFNQGLALLKEQGIVEQAYIAAGFFQPLVQDWQLLNPVD